MRIRKKSNSYRFYLRPKGRSYSPLLFALCPLLLALGSRRLALGAKTKAGNHDISRLKQYKHTYSV
jgi:hypothetical protein